MQEGTHALTRADCAVAPPSMRHALMGVPRNVWQADLSTQCLAWRDGRTETARARRERASERSRHMSLLAKRDAWSAPVEDTQQSGNLRTYLYTPY